MKIKKLIDSFNYAIEGIIYTFKTEKNMKIHFAAAILVLILSLFYNFSKLEMIAIIVTISLVLMAEMINTAVETIVDLITDEYHVLAKIAKDIAAGAVLITALNAIFVAYLLFFNRLNPWTNILLTKLKNSPAHVTFITLIVVMIVTIILKAYFGKGTPLRGGLPSGHSAIAFCLATASTFISKNILLSTISFIMAFMVAQSRVEGNIHSTFQVIVGAIIGILITVLFFQIVK
ncbi:diacylglycerol kinase [Thermoanaerobacterium thermosaccharolyticum]|uniref:Diacylglycerol kinase n=1 Tax=Thermoanaerobacterium thermosaccharolyticum (strain ATCC 7956 / DSM 571 / NCIMB 9385 / NCA 3814 / NCTC 13789 / WDCM 00135 / 2032) TaxID=580327 RepID=D9TPN6_THETC|nr:diacylglycerol kinase [Thermoanaerobacterium thermosaccharolyticum]ADL68718.1 diacylglycerol kinase [Thermoanaerobacterium thermosaccharolyticum DSM 571]KAA5806692.1 phosphatase PAP2 family protein [Thermoanaerobacterium thermosaccharolyticum]